MLVEVEESFYKEEITLCCDSCIKTQLLFAFSLFTLFLQSDSPARIPRPSSAKGQRRKAKVGSHGKLYSTHGARFNQTGL